ncbi:MAG: CBS domain-containing protein [Myxococcales bacterium]|nr:CBS domain-containing protein [Myxococcales bacterium]
MRCQDIMTKNPATLQIEATVQEAARLMAEKDVGFVPIVDKSGVAVGTVTDRDIAIRCVAKGLDARTAKLSDFGGNQVICCQAEDDVSKAKQLMSQNKIQRILVCDANKKPVGVISLQDLAESAGEQEVGETVRNVKQEGAPGSVH